jgi:peptide/nickel transport system substrate-binding protein
MTERSVPSFLPSDLDRRQALKIALGASAFGVLAACGSSSGGSAAGGPASGGTSSQPAVKHSNASISSVTWGVGTGTIIGLDIASAFDGHAMYVQRCGLEGLLAATNTLGLGPLLATSWKYEPASLKYVFQIRPGVKFWDGSTMTVDDVVFSLTRHIDPKVGSQIGAYFANVDSFVKTGASELTIKLKHPDPDVANSLVFAPILSRKFVQKIGSGLGSPGSGLRIMGTGPYQITSFPSSTSCTLERFEGYWDTKPAVQKCSFTCIADAQTLLLAAQSGQIDGTFDVPVQNASNWQKVTSLRTYAAPGMSMFYLSFDVSKPPWNDLHARKAVAYAANTAGYVRAFVGGNGTPASCVVPPQQWGPVLPQAQVAKLYATLPKYPYSIAAAKKELAQSATPHGFTTNKLLIPNSLPALVNAAESLSLTLKQIGIILPVEQVGESQWLANLYAHKDAIGIVASEFGPDYADPADYINLLYPSANAVKNNFNTANFKDPQVDKLLTAASSAAADADRAKYLFEVLKISAEQLPYLALWWQDDIMAVQSKYVYENFTGLYYNQNWLSRIFTAS